MLPDWLTEEPLVYVTGLHAVQCVNNWIKKILEDSQIWLSEEFFEFNYFQIGQACSPLTYCVGRRRTLTIRVPYTK